MRRHRKPQSETELDITSFMNLMIILVPVLLLSMVFNQITVLELSLPLDDDKKQQDNKDDEDNSVEVVVRNSGFQINLGPVPLKAVPKKAGQFDYDGLSTVLQAVKKQLRLRGEDRRDIVILSEPDIDYQVLVSVIDTAKTFPAVVAASVVDAVLFPDVSLGDAPEKSEANLASTEGQL